jgi:hypothetical protein
MKDLIFAITLLAAGAAQGAADLPRRGEGTLRWFGIRVYDATLWAGDPHASFLAPLRLELLYARPLSGRAIAERSAQEIARLGFGTPAQRDAWLADMRRLFPDVGPGDRLTGEHLPGYGARFTRNGQSLGEVADPAFSRAFFSIWLDPRTSEPALRAALLGER